MLGGGGGGGGGVVAGTLPSADVWSCSARVATEGKCSVCGVVCRGA